MKFKSIILSTSLIIASANANGIPVLDVNSLTQSVKNYQQMIKDYEEQVKQGLNQIQQMAEQGIGMDISEVLGENRELLNNTLSNLDYELPKEIFQETTDITNACAFLAQESEEFEKAIEQAEKNLKDKITACINTVSAPFISDEINKLETEAHKYLQDKKMPEYNKIKTKIQNIRQAVALIKEQNVNNKASRIALMLDTYENSSKENPYSKAKMQDEIQKFTREMSSKNLNQKQAQAMTNTMLLKLLELSQKNYEASLNFYNLQTEAIKDKINKESKARSYEATPLEIHKDTSQLDINKNLKYDNIIYDEYGFPDFKTMMRQ